MWAFSAPSRCAAYDCVAKARSSYPSDRDLSAECDRLTALLLSADPTLERPSPAAAAPAVPGTPCAAAAAPSTLSAAPTAPDVSTPPPTFHATPAGSSRGAASAELTAKAQPHASLLAVEVHPPTPPRAAYDVPAPPGAPCERDCPTGTSNTGLPPLNDEIDVDRTVD